MISFNSRNIFYSVLYKRDFCWGTRLFSRELIWGLGAFAYIYIKRGPDFTFIRKDFHLIQREGRDGLLICVGKIGNQAATAGCVQTIFEKIASSGWEMP